MARFKTAYLQRAVPFDVEVVGSVNEGVEVTASNRKAAICRNDFVVFKPATSTVNAYIEKATAVQVTSKVATHIVALSDMTIGTGHVPTDRKDYRPSDLVGATTASVPTGLTGTKKKVMLYPIYDYSDVIADADKNDVKA